MICSISFGTNQIPWYILVSYAAYDYNLYAAYQIHIICGKWSKPWYYWHQDKVRSPIQLCKKHYPNSSTRHYKYPRNYFSLPVTLLLKFDLYTIKRGKNSLFHKLWKKLNSFSKKSLEINLFPTRVAVIVKSFISNTR